MELKEIGKLRLSCPEVCHSFQTITPFPMMGLIPSRRVINMLPRMEEFDSKTEACATDSVHEAQLLDLAEQKMNGSLVFLPNALLVVSHFHGQAQKGVGILAIDVSLRSFKSQTRPLMSFPEEAGASWVLKNNIHDRISRVLFHPLYQ